MKLSIYTILFLSFACMAGLVAAQPDDYGAQMELLLMRFDNASDAAERKLALDAMTDLDKKYNGSAIKQMWNELDEKTATGADYRRAGLAMAAGHEKKACKWCFRKGAELGDPYCANQVLLEQLSELNYPEAAMYLFPKIKSYTLPLMHNMALALYVLNTPEARKLARQLAESFFLLVNNKENQYNIYDNTEYIDYLDTDILKAHGKCWQVSHLMFMGDPWGTLRKFYKESN